MSQPENVAKAALTRACEVTEAPAVSYSQSAGLIPLLAKLGIAIAFTSYQTGILYFLGRDSKGAHLSQTGIAKPMGLASDGKNRLVLSAGFQLIDFEDPLAAHERVNGTFDRCFVPRTLHITGQLDAHDVGLTADGGIVFVNTRFNCLSTIDRVHSFLPIWKPAFISEIIDEDRCHLNGLAMKDGVPAFVTAVSRSNTIDGWRDRRVDGGVVIDVADSRIVCEGLSMPHSPRLHRDKLWVLNSGTGELGVIEGYEANIGKFVPRVFCPGFLRGLSFCEDYAFVGLSKPRYKRFEGLALEQKLVDADSEAWCGIQIVDLKKGSCAEWFRIDGTIGELYDVEVVPDAVCPMAISPNSSEIATFVTR